MDNTNQRARLQVETALYVSTYGLDCGRLDLAGQFRRDLPLRTHLAFRRCLHFFAST